MTDEELTRDLVIKYIDRSCTRDELAAFFDLLKRNAVSLPEIDAAASRVWESEPEETPDADIYEMYRKEALALIRKHRRMKSPVRRIRPGRIAAIAASLAVIIAGGYYTVSSILQDRMARQLASYEYITTKPGEIRDVVLPDGTSVTMNVASTLKYNARFGKDTREVWLDGEAYFDVMKDAGCPFSIHAGKLDVNVTGTSFNVSAYADDIRKSVTVNSGHVGVAYGDDDIRMSLRPDEEIVINTADSSVSRSSVDAEDALVWIRGSLVFREQTLPEVIRLLRRYYSCDIELRDTTSSVRLSGTHDNKSLESVLESICFSAGLGYSKDGDRYIIH